MSGAPFAGGPWHTLCTFSQENTIRPHTSGTEATEMLVGHMLTRHARRPVGKGGR